MDWRAVMDHLQRLKRHQHGRHGPFSGTAWTLEITDVPPGQAGMVESCFALGSGLLGVRGALEERDLDRTSYPAAFVNGFYEEHPITYGEAAHAYAHTDQVMVAVPFPFALSLTLNGAAVGQAQSHVLDQRRVLDLRHGVLKRTLRWQAPDGVVLHLMTERMVLLDQPHVCVQRVTLRAESGVGAVHGLVDLRLPRPVLDADPNDPRKAQHTAGALRLLNAETWTHGGGLVLKTHGSGQSLAMATVLDGADGAAARHEVDGLAVEMNADVGEAPWSFTHVTTAYPDHTDLGVARAAVHEAAAQGFEALRAQQAAAWARVWEAADLSIEAAEAASRSLRFGMFQMVQGAGRDGERNIPAKGLTGDGYNGHTFWDSDVYAVPVFSHTLPQTARALLMARYRLLDAARHRAREMGLAHGALFPWRTIGGTECSAYYPAGTAAIHINAAIAHAVRTYVQASHDVAFMDAAGTELVIETARLWPQWGYWREDGGFALSEVTGPDEYTAMVENNAYTNLMAGQHLRFAAAEVRRVLAAASPLVEALGLTEAEAAAWEEIADALVIPRRDDGAVIAQDETFLRKPPWDVAAWPEDRYPLLLHAHPLVIYRHRVSKQPDVVLAHVLLPHAFDAAQQRRDFETYEPLTTHDSSLSPGIHAIASARLGMGTKALDYLDQTLRVDVDDLHGNTADGVHMACMATGWLALVQGFARMTLDDEGLAFDPLVPENWHGYAFTMAHRGRTMRVTVDQSTVTYILRTGEPLAVRHAGTEVALRLDTPATLSLSEGTGI